MGDTHDTLPPSKKRAAGRELSRDNPGLDDEEEASELDNGSFKKATDEVLASRRIVKVRRHQTSSTPSAPSSSNPFASIRLVPSVDSKSVVSEVTTKPESKEIVSEDVDGKKDVNEETDNGLNDKDKPRENKTDEAGEKSVADEKEPDIVNEGGKTELADEDKTEIIDNKVTECATAENKDKEENGNKAIEKSAEAASLSSFRQLSSSQNAFTGLTGSGFSSSTFSFGSTQKDGSPAGSVSGSLFGLKSDQSSYSSLGFNLPNNGSGSSGIFGAPGTSVGTGTKSEGGGFPSKQEVSVETGEENEKAVFTADSVLFEFIEGGWKERGKGELKVNASRSGLGKARLVMRARGNYRLILNASLYPDMKLTSMDKKGITFACMNSTGEGKDGLLSTFALKFKDASIVEEFRVAVTDNRSKTAGVLKTPENSP